LTRWQIHWQEIVEASGGLSIVFKTFRRLIDGPKTTIPWKLDATVHCEVALASLLKFGEVVIGESNGGLRGSIE
jgi:hypothetical protein